jgi:hypothetical protein
MNIKYKDAIDRVTEELRKDKSNGSYYHSWQANIAMAFKDEFDKYAKEHEIEGSAKNFNTHEIANNAAKNFLNLLCDSKESVKQQ